MFSTRYDVVIDPRDNSVTLGKKLYEAIEKREDVEGDIVVFKVKGLSGQKRESYGFMFSPDLEHATQTTKLQYCTKTKTIGFETLCPTVVRICYDYVIPVDKPVRLAVVRHELPDGRSVYIMKRPGV